MQQLASEGLEPGHKVNSLRVGGSAMSSSHLGIQLDRVRLSLDC